jgi:hypothetical protein
VTNRQNPSPLSIEEGLRRNREVYEKLSAGKTAPAAAMAEGEQPPSPPPPRPSSFSPEEKPLRMHEPPLRPESPAPAGKSDAPAVESIRFDVPGAVAYPALREEEPTSGENPAAAFFARLGREQRLRPQSMEVR